MIQKENTSVLALAGKKEASAVSVEFFFYADRENDACNLAIELHKLGYQVDGLREPGNTRDQWAITGITPKMKTEGEEFISWMDRMDELAKGNCCMFDGWGAMVDPADEDLEKLNFPEA
jgi:hypothetical protein